MNEALKPILAGIVRHLLTAAAGVLAAHGYLASSGTEQFIGAGMVLAGIAWSWWQKSGQQMLAEDLANARAILAARARGLRGPAPTPDNAPAAAGAPATTPVTTSK